MRGSGIASVGSIWCQFDCDVSSAEKMNGLRRVPCLLNTIGNGYCSLSDSTHGSEIHRWGERGDCICV